MRTWAGSRGHSGTQSQDPSDRQLTKQYGCADGQAPSTRLAQHSLGPHACVAVTRHAAAPMALWPGARLLVFVRPLCTLGSAPMRPPCATQRQPSPAASAARPCSSRAAAAEPSWRSRHGWRAAGAGAPARPPARSTAAAAEQHPDRRHEQLTSGVEELRDVEADPRYRRCAKLLTCVGQQDSSGAGEAPGALAVLVASFCTITRA